MNYAAWNHVEFLRMFRYSGETELEKHLLDRLAEVVEELEQCKEDMPSCYPEGL